MVSFSHEGVSPKDKPGPPPGEYIVSSVFRLYKQNFSKTPNFLVFGRDNGPAHEMHWPIFCGEAAAYGQPLE